MGDNMVRAAMTLEYGGMMTLAILRSQYVMNPVIVDVVMVLSIILLIITIRLWILNRIKKKNERKMIGDHEKLQQNCDDLEESINKADIKNHELEIKYEELVKSQELVSKLAYNDSLTELPNLSAFAKMLDNVMLTLRQEEVVAVLKLDMDDFKVINDTLGHSYGDELLIDVTHRLKQAITSEDYLARFGGDKFILLTQNITDISAYEDKIKKVMKMFSYPFVLSSKEFFVTVSIGVALAPKDGKSTQAVLKNVDSAMYAAKANGKNTYCYYDETMNDRLLRKIEMQSELRKAIDNEEFVVFYQPIFSICTKNLVGFEALLRWEHKEKGIILPSEFLPLAEETGLIVQIGQFALLKACKELKYWNDKGYQKIQMSVNMSAREFKDRDFLQMVTDIIDETKVRPSNLQFEITENTAFDDFELIVTTIKKLQDIGIQVSLDDFGTGYSSINCLKKLPVNSVKLDRAMIATILENEIDQSIMKPMIDMAKVLHLEVIAEGIENQETADLLEKLNCDKAQGYLYSKPISSSEAYDFLRHNIQLNSDEVVKE